MTYRRGELIARDALGLPHDLLEQVGAIEPGQLLEVVRRLVGAGLVIQDEDGSEVTYHLAHPLIQEVAAAGRPSRHPPSGDRRRP